MPVYNFTASAGTQTLKSTWVIAELWGGGASGGGATGGSAGTPTYGGGGAGGQYVKAYLGGFGVNNTLTMAVGQTKTGTAAAGTAGNDSTVSNPSLTVVARAKGGANGGGLNVANGAGGGAGSTASGLGDTIYAGGNGGNRATTSSGGGGGAAGTTGTGGNASDATAGAATADQPSR